MHCDGQLVVPVLHDWQTQFTQVWPMAQLAFELHALLAWHCPLVQT